MLVYTTAYGDLQSCMLGLKMILSITVEHHRALGNCEGGILSTMFWHRNRREPEHAEFPLHPRNALL